MLPNDRDWLIQEGFPAEFDAAACAQFVGRVRGTGMDGLPLQALELEQRRPTPDGARLSELIKALAEARNRARQAPISD